MKYFSVLYLFCIILIAFLAIIGLIYGLVLGFSAHVLIGVGFLCFFPLATAAGLLQIFFDVNVAEQLVKFINL